jgi:hypothetical protein
MWLAFLLLTFISDSGSFIKDDCYSMGCVTSVGDSASLRAGCFSVRQTFVSVSYYYFVDDDMVLKTTTIATKRSRRPCFAL